MINILHSGRPTLLGDLSPSTGSLFGNRMILRNRMIFLKQFQELPRTFQYFISQKLISLLCPTHRYALEIGFMMIFYLTFYLLWKQFFMSGNFSSWSAESAESEQSVRTVKTKWSDCSSNHFKIINKVGQEHWAISSMVNQNDPFSVAWRYQPLIVKQTTSGFHQSFLHMLRTVLEVAFSWVEHVLLSYWVLRGIREMWHKSRNKCRGCRAALCSTQAVSLPGSSLALGQLITALGWARVTPRTLTHTTVFLYSVFRQMT